MNKSKHRDAIQYLVSIHDVKPDTLDRVTEILDLFFSHSPGPVTLLVVPGRFKDKRSIDRLHVLLEKKVVLAGHGWNHKAGKDRDLYHKMHSLLLSRDAAEHLSRSKNEIITMMRTCKEWFSSHGFGIPDLYVPPAWAMGNLEKRDLRFLPFKMIETQTGIYNLGHHITLPLLGFEADTPARKVFLYAWNILNCYLATHTKYLRIAVHPYDLDFGLEKYLRRCAATATNRISYKQLS